MEINFSGLFAAGERIAVALSGGKDSVALFHALGEAADSLGIEVCAVNVEHGIRGESSLDDSEFVRKICGNAQKRALFYRVDAPARAKERGETLEQAARELRYECFFKAIEDGFCDRVATAHHADDNAETVLLNIFRGSGISGLCGIPRIAYGGKIIRPMLSCTRREIDEYIVANNLQYVEDRTNFDDGYNRNFIRLNILPLIKERYPEIVRSLLRLSRIAEEEGEELQALARNLVREGEDVRIVLGGNAGRAVLSRAVITAMKAAGFDKDYTHAHVEAVCGLANLDAGARISLPHGLVAVKCYGEIKITKEQRPDEFLLPFKEGVFELEGGRLIIKKEPYPEDAKNQKTAFFAQKRAQSVLYIVADLPASAVIRSRRTGDMLAKFGGGTVSLKEYLIDKKTERDKRGLLPIIADGSDVVCVAGMEVSASYAAKEGQPVYRIEWIPKEK